MQIVSTFRCSIFVPFLIAILFGHGIILAETKNRVAFELIDWRLSDAQNREVSTQTGDSWEKALGDDFNGTATYRTKLPKIETKGSRILLQFEAVATRAVVKVNGKMLGEHLGGWTPFRVDITDDYRPDALVEVVVDELPGHNTQGFLPVFIPHFGGIWGKVELLLVPDTAYIDDLSLFAAAWETDQARIELSVQRSVGFTNPLSIGIRAKRSEQWTWNPLSDTEQSVALKLDESITKEWPIWSPENPTGTDCEFVLRDDSTGVILDRQERRVYRRTVKAIGRDIYLNNKPISIRGVLNWGYAPPRLCPSRDPDWMRSELEFIKARGFNTMKFCLWIPPREYLELCDEMGILAWIEYPTWHPKLTQEFLPQLMKEYEEFFLYDRNHPSVILRSLTCETGHSAELQVIKSIYDKAHELIPGSLVEDDSSWISWQRVHDFYDDHPYGNNHKWRGVLQGLDDFIKQREPKPLVLGEAIAADTWTDANTNMPDAPHTLLSHPKSLAAEQQIKAWMGDDCNWRTASFLHAMETRKFQIERFRHQLPRQGYNVSVIRDFPFASMGLIDFENKPKTTVEQWSWHGEQMICLETPEDCRSFFNGIETEFMFHLLEPGVGANQIEWNVNGEEQPTINVVSHDTNQSRLTVKVSWQPRSKSLVPTPVSLVVKWLNNNRLIATNQWTLWIVPSLNELKSPPRLLRHDSIDPKKLIDCPLFRNAGLWSPGSSDDKAIVIASAFDYALWKWLNAGGKVLMLPDGRTGSFPIAEHWFLRGGPIVNRNSFIDSNTAEMMESLQAFDLAGPVMPNLSIIDEIEPWILLWDNHDIREYRFHACSWGANVGQGQLLVSTLETNASRGAATQHFLSHALGRLAKGRFSKSLKEETLSRMEQDLKSELMEIPRNDWSFKADPKKQGVDGGWHSLAADASWGKIRIGEHWDGQGYQGLDGWAWYTKELTIPNGANYMIFTGVDDYFEVFVDGQKCGTGGDLKNRKTAFDMVIPIPIPADKRGNVRVSILVDDWQGAGGIFRKVFFSSELPSPKPAILQRKTIQQTP